MRRCTGSKEDKRIGGWGWSSRAHKMLFGPGTNRVKCALGRRYAGRRHGGFRDVASAQPLVNHEPWRALSDGY
jgi:hypothetical protein